MAPAQTTAAKRKFKPWLIGILSALLLGGGIYGGIELSKRHTLTESERAQAEGWFQSLSGRTWLLVQRADDVAPGQSMTISRPSVSADNYGKTTITVSVELSGHSDEYDHGRFGTQVERPYTDLNEPRELDLCDNNTNAGEGSCLTWRIINADSITLEIRNDEGEAVTYYGIPAERFAALRAAAESARKQSLIHTVDSLTQNGGLLRRGLFRTYACGEECVATFLITQNEQTANAAYVCNNNRFGDIQLSQGNMIGEGDFTNQTLVGRSFLIVTQRTMIETNEGDTTPLDVITGLLPITDEEITPELQQRLAVATNVDMLTANGTNNTVSSAEQFLDDGAVRELKDVQVQPTFPGGMEAMHSFMNKSMKYPDMEYEAGIQGTVYVQFTVAKDGAIEDAKVLRAVSDGLDREALRVVKSMPRWYPGQMDGKPVKCRFNLPLVFKLK